MLSSGIDQSFGQTLHFGAAHGYTAGSGLISTFGPLGFVFYATYFPATFLWLVALRLALAAATVWTLAWIGFAAWGSPLGAAVALFACAPFLAPPDMPALVPPPRRPLLAYHGVLAPRARWRAVIMPPARDDPDSCSPGRLTWATLLRRVFSLEVLVCPCCGGPRRVLGAVTEPHRTAGAGRAGAGRRTPAGPPRLRHLTASPIPASPHPAPRSARRPAGATPHPGSPSPPRPWRPVPRWPSARDTDEAPAGLTAGRRRGKKHALDGLRSRAPHARLAPPRGGPSRVRLRGGGWTWPDAPPPSGGGVCRS